MTEAKPLSAEEIADWMERNWYGENAAKMMRLFATISSFIEFGCD